MAVIITDNRTEWHDCDTADWDGSVSDAVFTSAPAPKELTGCLGFQVSQAEHYVYYTGGPGSPINMSAGILVYVWVLTQGTINSTATGGIQLLLGDGTDRIGYYVAGSDIAGFRHDTGGVGWQCLLVDTSTLPTSFKEHTGTEATLTFTAITDIGAAFNVTSKSLGGAENCFADVVKYGNGGLTITGGGSGTEGNFSEIAAADAADTTGASSYGICRELGAGLFGLQGPLAFGDTGTGSVDFYSTDETIAFEDRNIGTSKYYINVTGNATGTTAFQLGAQVGTSTSGSNGVSLFCPSGIGASFDASNTSIEEVLIYGSSFSGFNNGIDFSADATNGPNHEIYGTSFSECGQIDPGKTLFKNNSISATTDATGGILLDADGTAGWADLSFTSDGTGHAIYITAIGTYAFSNFTYSNYGADATTDAVIYNNSGGLVTINVTGGDTPTVLNGASASTTVNNNKAVDIHVQDAATDDIVGAVVAIYDSSDDSELSNSLTDANGDITQASIAGGTSIYIRVRRSTTGTRYYPIETVATVSDNLALTITLVEDTTAT